MNEPQESNTPITIPQNLIDNFVDEIKQDKQIERVHFSALANFIYEETKPLIDGYRDQLAKIGLQPYAVDTVIDRSMEIAGSEVMLKLMPITYHEISKPDDIRKAKEGPASPIAISDEILNELKQKIDSSTILSDCVNEIDKVRKIIIQSLANVLRNPSIQICIEGTSFGDRANIFELALEMHKSNSTHLQLELPRIDFNLLKDVIEEYKSYQVSPNPSSFVFEYETDFVADLIEGVNQIVKDAGRAFRKQLYTLDDIDTGVREAFVNEEGELENDLLLFMVDGLKNITDIPGEPHDLKTFIDLESRTNIPAINNSEKVTRLIREKVAEYFSLVSKEMIDSQVYPYHTRTLLRKSLITFIGKNINFK